MDQIAHEVRLANWKQIIEECHARLGRGKALKYIQIYDWT